MKKGEKAAGGARSANQPSAAEAWREFEQTLASVLAIMEEDQFIVLMVKRDYPFVQFAAQGGYGLRAEAVSNNYLPRKHKLSESQIATLGDLGWYPPTGTPEEATPDKQPEGAPNYFQDFAQPVPWDDVAELAVKTFIEVFGVCHPGHLQYDAFDAEGRKILLPTLKIAARASAPSEPPPPVDEIEHAREMVRSVIRKATEDPEADFDEDGDMAVRFGSAIAYVRVIDDPLFVRVFSPVLVNVEGDEGLLRRLNEINSEIRFARLIFTEGTVIAALDIFAAPLSAEHIDDACNVLGNIADQVDDLLQAEFGGRTAFGEFRPRRNGDGHPRFRRQNDR